MPLAGAFLTSGNFCLIEQVCGTGIGGPPTHGHPSDEGLYVLEGHRTVNAGGKTVKAGQGTLVSVPRLVEYSFTVDAPHSRLLNFYTPDEFEMLLMSLATPAAERKAPVPGSTPMPPRWMVEECSREFGQIPAVALPLADPPTRNNIATKQSTVNPGLPYGVNVSDAPAYWSQGILWTILATAEQTGGSYSLMEEFCPKDAGPPPHTHEQDEAIYVIDGELTMIAGGETLSAKAGALAYIPA